VARPDPRRLADGALVLAGGAVLAVVLQLAGVPSAPLFGGLLAGLVRGLAVRTPVDVPSAGTAAAQAVVGVSIGALVDLDTLAAIGEDWLPVLLVTVATLLLTVAAGLLLRLQPGITPVTGAFAMIAGGASGITAMARDLGADDRMVAVLQYLRVLLIVVLVPVVATTLYGAQTGAQTGAGTQAAGPSGPGWPGDLLVTVACVLVGIPLARLVRLPVPALLGPMLVAATADLSGIAGGADVPAAVEAAAFLLIGLQVGVRFTVASLRTVGRALPLALVLIVGLVAACAGLGVVLSAATGVSRLDAYLATTPGGLYAVLATATGTGADATFVLAVQVLRLFVMLLAAPLVARRLRPRPG